MRSALASSLLLGLALAACGSDEPEAPVSQPAIYEVSVAEFIAELQPQKAEILEALVADAPACANAEVDNAFVLLISAEAIDADRAAPLESIVTGQC